MPNMPAIAKAAMDFATTVLTEYPEASEKGLGVAVNVPQGNYTVTLTPPVVPPPAPEEQLLTHPAGDTPVSNGSAG